VLNRKVSAYCTLRVIYRPFLKKYYTNSARSELFRETLLQGFPLQIGVWTAAPGLFEPHHHEDTAYPYFCHYPDDEIFFFAGIYSDIGDGVYSTTILTVDANDFFLEVHNKKKRIPLVLDKEFEEQWLKSDLQEPHVKELMKVGFTTKEFEAYPGPGISTRRESTTIPPKR
jgi:hypothetical protein